MKRYATIAIVWLLPPLLFVMEVAAHHGTDLPIYPHVIFGIVASLAGAIFASRADPAPPPAIPMFVAGIVILVPLVSVCSVILQGVVPHEFFVLSMASLVIWIAAMPLWGAVLFWRPDVSKTSLSFAAATATCMLPFAIVSGFDLTGQALIFRTPPSFTQFPSSSSAGDPM